MKWGASIIPTMVAAFFLVPALFADDTPKPGDAPKKNESMNSASVPPVSAKPEPAPEPLFVPAAGSWPLSPAAEGLGEHSRTLGARSSESRNTPKAELFIGYSFWRAVPDTTHNRIDKMHGGSTSLAYNLNNHLGFVFDFAGFDVDSLEFTSPGPGFSPSRQVDAEGTVFSALVGPRVSFRNHDRFTPFLQVLGGIAHADDVNLNACSLPIYACRPLPEETAFAMTAGGGLDYRLNHRFALRLLQAEFLLARFRNPTSLTGDRGWQSNVRLSAGLVIRFGGHSAPPPPPNRSPVVSCSADKAAVYAGSGDSAVVRADASDPDSDPLTYSWSTNGGAVEGSGPEARWSSSGAAPGTYTVKVRVEDGRGGSADCSADIRVEPPPNRPPSMSCSANHSSVVIGETVQITVTASDPDNDPLSYSWKSSGGSVRGRDSSVRFETTGLKAGRYSVSGHVEDGRGGAADCELGIELQDPPPPPEMVELEARLSLHSIYFATARPSASNPTGGIVGSQENILAKLAEDFKRYLTFKPDAHLILGGHADERGSEEYNRALTERRVERARSYLIAHGVSAAAIETRSFGKEDELNAEQIKAQIAQNPDINQDERQQMLNNLQVMVLANNRRVDITLSTTGQQSTRRYPFNAKDFLALISTKDGEKKPSAKKTPRR
jgi:outer membrane protein OmpA-like peptidoglycan-associated protein